MTRSTEPSTTSMPSPLSKSSAMMARSRRLVLFRVTALPTALETINPALGSSSVDEYLQIQQRSDCRNGNRNVVYQKIVLQCVSVGVAVALDQAPVATGTDTSY